MKTMKKIMIPAAVAAAAAGHCSDYRGTIK